MNIQEPTDASRPVDPGPEGRDGTESDPGHGPAYSMMVKAAYSDVIRGAVNLLEGWRVGSGKGVYDSPLYRAKKAEQVYEILARGRCRVGGSVLRRDGSYSRIAKDADQSIHPLALTRDVTPLHTAANEEVAKALIANGADTSAKDRLGRRPIHIPPLNTAKEASAFVSAVLGGNPNIHGRWGLAPIHTATTAEATCALIKLGANPNLEVLVSEGDRDVFPNAPKHRATPLHFCTTQAQADALYKAGALVRKAAGNVPFKPSPSPIQKPEVKRAESTEKNTALSMGFGFGFGSKPQNPGAPAPSMVAPAAAQRVPEGEVDELLATPSAAGKAD